MTGVFQYFTSSTLVFETCDFEIVLDIYYNKEIIEEVHPTHNTESFTVWLPQIIELQDHKNALWFFWRLPSPNSHRKTNSQQQIK